MTTQTEAERLADLAERHPSDDVELVRAAAELRRLVSFNNDLMDEVARLKNALAEQPPVKTYHDGKPWPVAPAPDPVPIIRQLVVALEGSGTRMRSDQWYVEIEAVAAGKHYLNSINKEVT